MKKLALVISIAGVTIWASGAILASAAEARGGRGGGGGFSRGGGGGFSRGGSGGFSRGGGSWGAKPSRPSNGPGFGGASRGNINPNINRGQYGNRGNYGGNRGNYGGAGGNYNGNRNINQNINRNTNINRNINIDNDWDGNWGGGYGGYYRPGAGLVAGAVAGAAIAGAYYSSLPPSCVSVYRVTTHYYQCGSVWYQPTYAGTTVQYVVVNAP